MFCMILGGKKKKVMSKNWSTRKTSSRIYKRRLRNRNSLCKTLLLRWPYTKTITFSLFSQRITNQKIKKCIFVLFRMRCRMRSDAPPSLLRLLPRPLLYFSRTQNQNNVFVRSALYNSVTLFTFAKFVEKKSMKSQKSCQTKNWTPKTHYSSDNEKKRKICRWNSNIANIWHCRLFYNCSVLGQNSRFKKDCE